MKTTVIALALCMGAVLATAACSPEDVVTLDTPIQTCSVREELTRATSGEGCRNIAKGTKLLIVSEQVVDELTFECVRQEREAECRWVLGPVKLFAKG